jgi:1-acyl-sn-glycerol-3-phosphate acyltransferase
MKIITRFLFALYFYTLFFPLVITWMILIAILAGTSAVLFGQRTGSFLGRVWAMGTCLLSFVRVKVTGKENLSESQSYVIVANHSSQFDIYSLYGYVGRDIRWMMKKELMRTPFLGWACKLVGHISVDRSNPRKAAETIERAKKALKKGTSVVFFPEGSRTRTGKMSPFKRGAFLTAQGIGLPVVPVAIQGSFDIMRPGTRIIRPGRVIINILPPVELKALTKEEILAEMEMVHNIIEKRLNQTLS